MTLSQGITLQSNDIMYVTAKLCAFAPVRSVKQSQHSPEWEIASRKTIMTSNQGIALQSNDVMCVAAKLCAFAPVRSVKQPHFESKRQIAACSNDTFYGAT
jgi:hypothetical protein